MARHRLKARREQQGLTQEQLALSIGVATSTYREWERGLSTPRVGFRPRLAEQLDVSLVEIDAYLNEHESEPVGPPSRQAVPTWLTLYASLEQGASHLWTFQPMTVHALLQTPAYATAVERIGPRPPTDEAVRRRVELRLARQGVLSRTPDPLRLSVVLDESVLLRVTGGPEVMAEQLAHLAAMAQQPNIELRLLPLDAGVHAASFGAFTLLASEGAVTAQMACVTDRTGVRYLEGAHAVDAHVEVF
ncbi:MAG TPA: helix-turn-helix transcriptional regulator, partial [Acidimicrobiales bacterium]